MGFARAASARGSARKLLFLVGRAEVVRQDAFAVRLLQTCADMFSFSEACLVPTADFFFPLNHRPGTSVLPFVTAWYLWVPTMYSVII